jgi:hypothetical protein
MVAVPLGAGLFVGQFGVGEVAKLTIGLLAVTANRLSPQLVLGILNKSYNIPD